MVRYAKLPDIIRDWTKDYLDLEQSSVLDFGCGQGITALGMAMRHKARKVYGVDIMPDVLECLPVARSILEIGELPHNLHLSQISPGEDFFPEQRFDMIYSWSVFEHVNQQILDSVLASLHNKLNPNGYLFIQIAPLFYSAEGAHLFHRIPIPWGHLTLQESNYFTKLCEACDSKEEVDALWSCFQTLNRLTADELRQRLIAANFSIVREHTTQDPHVDKLPKGILQAYQHDVLTTDQIVILATSSRN